MKKFIIFLAIVSLVCAFSCKKKPTGEAIKIGVVGPMNFVQGKGHWNGAIMAAEEINDNGGVKVGDKYRPIEVIKYDSNEFLSITDATNAMQRAINKDNVDFIVGGFRTEAVLAMQDIAMDYKKIFIGCGAADDQLCTRVKDNYNRYKYWFRGTPFKSSMLGKTVFIQLGTVAAIVGKTLGIKPKVAIVAEKQAWVEPILKAAKHVVPNVMKIELVGIWQPSQTATDVSAELSAIQRAGANIIFTVFSASVGVTFAKQANELKIPAVMIGINVEAQKSTFNKATGGMGDYVCTLNTYCEGVEVNDLTEDFVKDYMKRFNEVPTYTADTYTAIKTLVQSIEAVGSLNADAIVAHREKTEFKVPTGKVAYDPDHDLKWGPGYLTSIGIQWQDGKMKAFWPNNWVPAPGVAPVTYKGMVPLKLPPWMIEKYKK